MWRCPKCHANLLDNTRECPVCQLSPDQAAVVRPASPEPSSKFWFWVLVGVLIPPLGLVMLLTYLLTPPDKDPL
jgi:hypothetical protein